MSYSKDGKDWLGKERVEHYDDKGNKVGPNLAQKKKPPMKQIISG